MNMETALDLGQDYKDDVTGFEGVCTGVTVYLNGCIQGLIESRKLKDDGTMTSMWIDEQRLVARPLAVAGGPQNTPPGLSRR